VVLQLLQIARPSLTLRDLTPWKRLLHERWLRHYGDGQTRLQGC
jgi:hypothetical protein